MSENPQGATTFMNAAVLIIGSLWWDKCDVRTQWRADHLLVDQARHVAAPVRYGRKSTMPGLAADPDGAVSLDWIVSRPRMFSVSCGPSGRLAYSWLDGTDRGHAVADFDGWTIPQRILHGIRSINCNG